MTTWYNLAPQPNWQEWLGVTISCNPSEFVFAANYLNNTISTSSGSNYFTGKAVMVNSVGGVLPTPLSASSVYYIIFIDSTTFKLATTYANALGGTALTLTSNGTGTLTIISTGTVYLQPNANGYINTYSSLSHQINKPTYTDWTGSTPNPNPIILDDKGMAAIYWAVNSDAPSDNYYIEIYTANGVLLYSRDNFNAPPGIESAGGDVVGAQPNLVLNNEFDFWGMYDYGINDISVVTADCSVINFSVETAYYWTFSKNNNNATDILTRQLFPAGQTDVPNTPVYYLNVACTSAGIGGETYKEISQQITNVQNLASQTVTLSYWARSTTNGTLLGTVFYQHFGSGGSTQVETEGDDASLTTAWALYTTTVALPDLSSKSIGTNSYLDVSFSFPINSTYSISIANVQLTVSDSAQPYRQLTSNERFTLLSADKQASCGDIKVQSFGIVPDSWIMLNNGTIGNGSSAATLLASPNTTSLFTALWNNYNDAICPVYDKTGVKVVRGASAIIDYAADYQISAFFSGGRVISNTSAPAIKFVYTTNFAVTPTLITIAGDSLYANRTLFLGTAITLTTAGTVPSPLALATTYYVAPIDTTIGTYSLATSYANAVAGVYITLLSDGSGIQQVSINNANPEFQTAVAGQSVGESGHYMQLNDLVPHHHVNTAYDSTGLPNATGFSGAAAASGGVNKSSSTVGVGNAMNITQPTLALPYIIKL